jgi:hypothetical protein
VRVHLAGTNGGVLNKGIDLVRFQVFMAVTMKNAVFWYVTPCGVVPKSQESVN